MLVKEGIGVGEMWTLMKEALGGNLSEYKVWHGLKYDKQMLIAVERGMHLMMIFKRNDEHENLCVVGNDGPKRWVQKGAEACEGRAHTFDDGMVYDSSRRGGVIVVQKGRKRDAKQGGVKEFILCKDVYDEIDYLVNVIKLSWLCLKLQVNGHWKGRKWKWAT